jgi:hypothetical protein
MPNETIDLDELGIKPRGFDLGHFESSLERFRKDVKSGKIKLEKVNMSVYGTEQLTDVMIFLAKFASVAKAAVEDDGKVTIGDASKFVELIFPLINAVTQIQDVPKELKDMDPVEKEALIAEVKANLDLYENDEAAVESALLVVFELFNFLKIVGVIKPVDPQV